jgi:hypothetical protein
VNKELYNKEIEFPKNKREHMKKCFSMVEGADENLEGFKRNKELQDTEFIGYKQLKRIKNFFDNFKGSQKDPSFMLNGGFEMKNWVNDELRKMREFPKTTKQHKMDTGMENQFIDSHEKKDFTNVRPSKRHLSTVQKYDAAVTESLKRINEIISKL